jgi:hypothetical protein
MQHARERAGQLVRAFTREERLGRDRADALHKSDAIAQPGLSDVQRQTQTESSFSHTHAPTHDNSLSRSL